MFDQWERRSNFMFPLKFNLDHNDPSKPSHRLTNGPEPSKTIESNGSNIKNHRKTIDGNGQTAQKHSMVMVSSKTIENLQWSLQNHWKLQWFPQNHWTCQWFSQINILLNECNYPVVLRTVWQQKFLCKLYNINLTAQQTINTALKISVTVWQPLISL